MPLRIAAMMTLSAVLIWCAGMLPRPAYAADAGGCPLFPNALAEVARMRVLACNRRFDDLEKELENGQREYEARKFGERAMFQPYAAFNLPFDMPGFFEAWLAKYPNSYSAHIAAGRQSLHRALRARGTASAEETSREQFAEMDVHMARATAYLERSLKLSTRPYASYNYLVQIGRTYGRRCSRPASVVTPDACLRDLVDKALVLEPRGYFVRSHYMSALEPRWGGSIPAMESFYKEAEKAGLDEQDLKRLRAPVLMEKARVENNPEEKLRLAFEANQLVENTEHLHAIVHALSVLRRFPEVVPPATRALVRQPSHAWTLMRRGVAYWQTGRNSEAFADFLLAAELGDAFSQNKVGYFLWEGLGTAQNRTEAVKWWEKGAANGDKASIDNLQHAKTTGAAK